MEKGNSSYSSGGPRHPGLSGQAGRNRSGENATPKGAAASSGARGAGTGATWRSASLNRSRPARGSAQTARKSAGTGRTAAEAQRKPATSTAGRSGQSGKGSGPRGGRGGVARLVDGHHPRTLILVAAVTAVVVLLLALGVQHILGATGGSPQSTASSGTQSGDQTRVVAVGNGMSKVVIGDCSADQLSATSEISPGIYPGTGATITVTVTDVSTVQCSTSLDAFSLVVKSGGSVVGDSSGCVPSQSGAQSGGNAAASTSLFSGGDKTLLFAPKQSWTGTITWDGRASTNCAEDGFLDTGSYQGELLLDGHRVGNAIPIEVH